MHSYAACPLTRPLLTASLTPPPRLLIILVTFAQALYAIFISNQQYGKHHTYSLFRRVFYWRPYSQTIEFLRSLTTLHVLQYMYIPAIPDILGASYLGEKKYEL
jgi:hypothetical protein